MKIKIVTLLFGIFALYAFYDIMTGTVPSTIDDFRLPGSQPGESGNLEAPGKCSNCHKEDKDGNPIMLPQWQGSMMAQSLRDPLFHAALTIANQDAPQSGDLCLRCHTPDGWLGGRSEPTDGSALNASDNEGITCDFCHSLVKPTPLGINPYPNDSIYTADTYLLDQDYLASIASIPPNSSNGMYVVDNSTAKRGPFTDPASPHQFIYSPFHKESELCGTCHDVSNPAFSSFIGINGVTDYEPNLFGTPPPSPDLYNMMHIERTFSEWSMSAYNSPQGVASEVFGGNLEFVSTCQDCHMKDVTGKGCNKTPPIRDNLPMHDLTGGNTFIPLTIMDLFDGEVDINALNDGITRARSMLQNAATMELIVIDSIASVTVTNETGHKLPSGYPEGRRIWLNIKAWGPEGETFESGSYNHETADLLHDEQAKIYETEPGISPSLASVLNLEAGPSFHFVLNDTIYKDNRIPPRGFTNANFKSIQAQPVGYTYADGQYWDITTYKLPFEPIAVDAKLYYQTVSKEYITFLRDANMTDNKGQLMYDLWEANGKSTPELMVRSTWGEPIIDVDEDGYIAFVDCNDNDPNIHPFAIESADCHDNNCNNIIDERFNYEGYITWTGCNASDSWLDPLNWSHNRIPTATDKVLIPGEIQGNPFPDIISEITVSQLEILEGAQLTIEEGFTLNILSSNAYNNSLIVRGILNVEGHLNLSNEAGTAIKIDPLGTLNIFDEVNIDNYSEYGIENYGVLNIQAGSSLNIIANSGEAILNSAGAQLHISGVLNIIENP